MLAIVFGQVDPIFRTPVPVWNPLQWDPTQFTYVLTAHRRRRTAFFGPALLRTVVYVGVASLLCLLIAYPGRLLRGPARPAGARACCWPLLIAPFWISYMMRMLAWVNLLQNDGLVNKAAQPRRPVRRPT